LAPTPPSWIAESPELEHAYGLAAGAHGGQRRATDGRPFLEHVVEVAGLLADARCDTDLVVVGLLHDSVERGTLTEDELRSEVPEAVYSLVLTLTEDQEIESFSARKQALRDQVRNAGDRAVTVFAADKLSDILGLRRGLRTFGRSMEERMGTSIESMAGHYRESVAMIEAAMPDSPFLPELNSQLEELGAEPVPSVEHA
jgi:hypothetical protein